jgi:hypothetical protein
MHGLSAAHPTLPLPSFVRVTNLDSNRSIVVRVNDRGPVEPGRIIDLSKRGAQTRLRPAGDGAGQRALSGPCPALNRERGTGSPKASISLMAVQGRRQAPERL